MVWKALAGFYDTWTSTVQAVKTGILIFELEGVFKMRKYMYLSGDKQKQFPTALKTNFLQVAKWECVLQFFSHGKKNKFKSLLWSEAAFAPITSLKHYTEKNASSTETSYNSDELEWNQKTLSCLVSPRSIFININYININYRLWKRELVLDDVIPYCDTATSFVPERSLSAVSLQTFGICWSYLAHTNQLCSSSEAFWKSEAYWKQTGRYLHGRMSEIARLKATFSETLSSKSSWTDQAKQKVLHFGQAIKNWALFGEIQTLADTLLIGKRRANKDLPLKWSPRYSGHDYMAGL